MTRTGANRVPMGSVESRSAVFDRSFRSWEIVRHAQLESHSRAGTTRYARRWTLAPETSGTSEVNWKLGAARLNCSPDLEIYCRQAEILKMPSPDYFRGRRSQRGQTILLVAVSMVSLLAMAALAIDVVTLYVARTEVQRAADAAALAGAKAIADSGVTTLPSTDANLPAAITLAESMATSAINAVVGASAPLNNPVAGSPPALVSGYPTFNFAPNNNPTVTVVLQQTNLPTFFARIWGAGASSTSASATAEAYNPSNSPGGNFTQITPRCVKPWLVGNADPTNGGAKFIDEATGTVVANLATLTATPFNLQADCNSANPGCSPPSSPTLQYQSNPANPPILVQYLPMLVTPSAADACPSCADTTNNY